MRREKISKRPHPNLLLQGEGTILIILLVGLALRLVNLNQSFWLDEAAQVIESSRPLWQQFDIVADFHPPFFHLLLHFWLYLGNSEVWVRLLSIGFSLGSIFLLYKLAVLLKREKEGLLAAFFLAISPYHIWYSQEARPYMLFVATSIAATYFLIKRNWFLYLLSSTVALYSLYFAPFLILGHLVYILYLGKKDVGIFLKSLVITAVFFLPWLPTFWQQFLVGTGGFFSGWVEVVSLPTVKAVPLTFAKFIFGRGSIENNLIYSLVILPVFLIFFYSSFKIHKTKSGQALLILFLVPLILAATVSFFVPILAPQRLIFLLPIFYLLIAKGVVLIKGYIKMVALALLILTSFAGLFQYYTEPSVQREKWRNAVEFVEKETEDRSIALFVYPEPFAPYLWYKKDKVKAKGIAPSFRITDDDLRKLQPELVNYQRVYLFQYLTGLTDPEEKTRNFLLQNSFNETTIKDFPGVGFIYIFERVK